MTYSEEKFWTLLRDAKAQHRRAAAGECAYLTPEFEGRLAELGKAVENDELPDSLMEKAARGARFVSKHPPTFSS